MRGKLGKPVPGATEGWEAVDKTGRATGGAHLKRPRERPLEEEVTFWLSSFHAHLFHGTPTPQMIRLSNLKITKYFVKWILSVSILFSVKMELAAGRQWLDLD